MNEAWKKITEVNPLAELVANDVYLRMCVSGFSNSSISEYYDVEEPYLEELFTRELGFSGWEYDLGYSPWFYFRTDKPLTEMWSYDIIDICHRYKSIKEKINDYYKSS